MVGQNAGSHSNLWSGTVLDLQPIRRETDPVNELKTGYSCSILQKCKLISIPTGLELHINCQNLTVKYLCVEHEEIYIR
jgi:hypothetical protein